MSLPIRRNGQQPNSTAATRTDFVQAIEGALGLLQPRATVTVRTPDISLRDYTAGAWHVLEPATPFMHNWHVDAIADHLEACTRGEIRDLIINIPPRMSKSLNVCVLWPSWEWTFAPHVRQIFNSYVSDLSERDSVKTRNLIQSGWYQRRWGKVFSISDDQNEKWKFSNDKTGFRIATSEKGSNTGEGADRLVVDDPHDVKRAVSDKMREATLNWWSQTMSTRGNNPHTVVRVIVMQRLHELDLTGDMIARELGYEHLKLPMRYTGDVRVTSIGFKDPRTKVGELLHPARFNERDVQKLERDLGPYGTASQLQQEPAPAKGAVFEEGWFRFYTVPDIPITDPFILSPTTTIQPENVGLLPVAFQQSAQTWDMAFKGTKATSETLGTDFVVGHAWRRLGADMYLMPIEERGQWDIIETMAALERMTERYTDIIAKYIEDKANGPAVMTMLRSKIPGLVAIDPDKVGQGGDTIARARAAAPLVKAGNVWLPHPRIAPWIGDYVIEMIKFPKAAKDDRVAATAQMLLIFFDSLQGGSRWTDMDDDGVSQGVSVARQQF